MKNSLARYIPSPLVLAILLTFFTMLLALFITSPQPEGGSHIVQVLGFWHKGFWELLAFGMQMMLILILGYVIALSPPVDKVIGSLVSICKDTASAAALVCMVSVILGLLNWGLGLVVGAILARKVGEYARDRQIPLHYPLIGAAGYAGLMVWHGGLSGSTPLKINEAGDFLTKINLSQPIPLDQTLFSGMNIIATIALVILLPTLMYFIGKRIKDPRGLSSPYLAAPEPEKEPGKLKVTQLILPVMLVAALLITLISFTASSGKNLLQLINPNYINFLLFALAILSHGSLDRFQEAVGKAISSGSGILIQFPLYAGIMGIMKYSGLVNVFSDFFVSISTVDTFPIFTFISAGIVNFFVPSGGGQLIVQGPIIVEAANSLGVDLSRSLMALSYGDQLTNMLQPFWALPLLGITGLKASDILPYTALLMLCGIAIFLSVLVFC